MTLSLDNGTTPKVAVFGSCEPLLFNGDEVHLSEILSALKEYISSSDCCEKYGLCIEALLSSCVITNGWNTLLRRSEGNDFKDKYDYINRRIAILLRVHAYFPENTSQKPFFFRNYHISPRDAAHLLKYVLTNTDLDDTDDPRIDFVGSFNEHFLRSWHNEQLLYQKSLLMSEDHTFLKKSDAKPMSLKLRLKKISNFFAEP